MKTTSLPGSNTDSLRLGTNIRVTKEEKPGPGSDPGGVYATLPGPGLSSWPSLVKCSNMYGRGKGHVPPLVIDLGDCAASGIMKFMGKANSGMRWKSHSADGIELITFPLPVSHLSLKLARDNEEGNLHLISLFYLKACSFSSVLVLHAHDIFRYKDTAQPAI